MRIAIIGLGTIAKKAYLPILSNLENTELILCSRNQETLSTLAAKYRIKETTQDYKQLTKLNVDAVMIHSSTASHPSIARYFLEQGIPTFVDKPLADNLSDCERLYDLAHKNNCPLYLGFNRRFIPLYNQTIGNIQTEINKQGLQSLRWEKNRYNSAGDIHEFIFDDFIHPLDSVNIYGKSDLDDIQITTQFKGVQLARLDVQWQQNNTILHASMNRTSGTANEIISANFENCSYQFDSFFTGKRYKNNESQNITLEDWTPMLASKGFAGMIDDWLSVVKKGNMPEHITKRNLATHQLADKIYQHVLKMKP